MSVHTQYPTHLKRSIFTKIRSKSHDIPATIVVGIPYVSYLTGEYSPVAGTIFNLYGLLRNNSSVYKLFNAHLFP